LACPTLAGRSDRWPVWSSSRGQNPTRPRCAKWQLPERWTFIDEVPKTSVGKFDKKALRARHEAGQLEIVEVA
jgi:acyl-CoA synthetase (AMP-forming)/AMP-acid ligase II